MRAASFLLLCLAIMLVAARLFTGVVYEYDDPTTYLVVKRAPAWAIVQENTPHDPVRSRFVVLDGDENALVYQAPYVWLMRAAVPLAVGACLLAWVAQRKHRA